jgi:lipoate-protein ligase A
MFDKNTALPKAVNETRQELKTWEWIYGQTPEFTNTTETDMKWGHVVM